MLNTIDLLCCCS